MGTTMTIGAAVAVAALAVGTAAAEAPKPVAAPAGDIRAAARKVRTSHAGAIVTVRLTTKSRMVYQGQERSGPDQTVEIAGTVITPAGLTAVSDFSSNPAGLFAGMPGGPSVETETSEVKIILADGRELKARFVLRDQDLDLGFVAPVDPVTLEAVELVEGVVPGVLDELALVYPLGRSLGREMAATITDVRAVVTRPRTFVAIDVIEGWQALGTPAFDAAGRAVGLVVVRRAPAASMTSTGMRQLFDTVVPVVLTADDVLDVAGQAMTAAEGARE